MSHNRKKDEPGNTIAAQMAFDREMVRIASVLYRVDKMLDQAWEDDRLVTAIRVTFPTTMKSGFLAVLSSEVDGEKQVAFNNAETFTEALVGTLLRLENKSLTWKEDKWKNK